MQPNLNTAPVSSRAKSYVTIPPKQVEKGIARDMGWERLIPDNGLPLMLGMEDVLAVEREVPRLMRVKKLSLTETDLSSWAPSPDKKVAIEMEWYWHVGNLLQVANPMIRLSEPLEAVFYLARERGYLDSSGRLLPQAEIWRQPTQCGISQAREFLDELKAFYSTRTYQDTLRHREDQAVHNRGRHLLLLDYFLVKYGCFRVVAMDFYLDKRSAAGGIHPGYDLGLVIQCRGHFFNNVRFSPAFSETVYGYLWHLSFHQLHGYYFRVIFFVTPRGFGGNEKFIARASRVWMEITGGNGVCVDTRKHPNELAQIYGTFDIKNEKSIKKLERALLYQVEKDKRLRVMSSGRLHMFGHTEMADISQVMLDRASLRMQSSPSRNLAGPSAAQEDHLQRLYLEMAKKEASGMKLPYCGYLSMGGSYHGL